MKFLIRMMIAAALLFVLKDMFHPGWGEAAYSLLITGVLCWVASNSRATKVNMILALAGLYYIPQILINIPEGVLFDVIALNQAPLVMAQELAIAFIIALAVSMLFARDETAHSPHTGTLSELTVFGFIWRSIASVLFFIVCYFVAGMIIFPFVKSYYDIRVMPEMQAIVSMQVLRAFALLVTALLVIRIIPEKKKTVMLLAVSFPVVGCIAPMIPDNELMPPAIRFVHTIEVTPYYTLYGLLLAYWFSPGSVKEAIQDTGKRSIPGNNAEAVDYV